MRTSRLAMLVAGAVMLTGIASISPASADAYDYPWCAQGPSLGYPGECAYRTYEQCLASVSGRYLYCGKIRASCFASRRSRAGIIAGTLVRTDMRL